MPAPGAEQTLIERDREVGTLASELQRAVAGDGGLTLIEADAGMGKTRLLAALEARAHADGVRVLSARSSDLEHDFPFGVVRSLLGPVVRALPEAEREQLLAGAAAPAGVALGFTAPAADTPVQASPALLDAIYWVLDGLCAGGPLLLAVDDAHWADGPSLRALAYVANRSGLLPLALVCAQRRVDATSDTQATEGLRRVARTRLTPSPLTASGVQALARAQGLGELDDHDTTAVRVATRGNPFLITQLADEIAHHGTQALGAGTGISATALRGVVIGRLLRVPPAAQRVARAVAILGDGAHVAHVADLTDLSTAATLEAAAALAEAGLFDDAQRLAFTHPLLAEAIGSDVSAHEQTLAHLRAARLLRAAGADAERIAGHLVRSSPVGDPQAAEDLRVAAGEALRRGAPEVAAAQLARALAEPPAPDAVPAITRELGLAELAAGRPLEASEHLAGAFRDPAASLQDVASAGWAQVLHEGYPATIAALADAAAEREDDPEAALWMTGMAGFLNYFLPQAARRPLVLPAREVLRGDTPGERMALTAHLAASVADGTTADEVADMARRSLGDGALSADGGAHGAYFTTGPIMGLLYAERLDAAEQAAAEVERQARVLASGPALGGALFAQTYLHLLRGNMASAVAQSASALEVAAAFGGEVRTSYQTFQTALLLVGVLAHEGHDAAAAALAEHGLDGDLAPDQLWIFPVRAHVHLAGGRADAALADVQAWTGIAAMLGDPILPVEFHTALPLALLSAGDEDQALAAAEAVVARERAWGTAGRTAAALRTLADVAPGRAVELLQEALALAETAPLPLERARVLVAYGFALRRAGERTQARAILQRGLQLAASCQAGPLRDRALDELRVLGARPRRLAFDGLESLTRSERRVVDLAAGGATNREIAQQLFVSVKTVDSHLEHAYRKLGISSRKALPALLRGDGG